MSRDHIIPLVFVVLSLGCFFDLKKQWSNLQQLTQEYPRLLSTKKEKQAQTLHAALLKQQLHALDAQKRLLMKQSLAEGDIFLSTQRMRDIALKKEVWVAFMEIIAQEEKELYKQISLHMRVMGSYAQIKKFIKTISEEEKIIVDDFLLEKTQKNVQKDILSMTLTAKIHIKTTHKERMDGKS